MLTQMDEADLDAIGERLLAARKTRQPYIHSLEQVRTQTIHQSTNLTNLRLQISQCEAELDRARHNKHTSNASNRYFHDKVRELGELKQESDLRLKEFEESTKKVESLNRVIHTYSEDISELERVIYCSKT